MEVAEYRLRRKSVFLAQHERLEGKYRRALVQFFDKQARELARLILRSSGELVATVVLDVFDVSRWNAELKRISAPYVAEGTVKGVLQEGLLADVFRQQKPPEELAKLLSQAKAARRRSNVARMRAATGFKASAYDAFVEEPAAVSREVYEGVSQSVASQLSQPYWSGINETTRDWMFDTLGRALGDPDGAPQGAFNRQKFVRELTAQLGEKNQKRAKTIARTEMTTAMNAGHQVAMEKVADIGGGLIEGKEWLATVDDDTRLTHAEAGGQIVGIKEPFSVAGYDAMYPGDISLPAEERVNCRCSSVTAFTKTAADPVATGGPADTGDASSSLPDTTDLYSNDVFFHGSGTKFDSFDMDYFLTGADAGGNSWYGKGMYLSGEQRKAHNYALAGGAGDSRGYLYSVRAKNLRKPLVVKNMQTASLDEALTAAGVDPALKDEALTQALMEKGYDHVAVLKKDTRQVTELVVFDVGQLEIVGQPFSGSEILEAVSPVELL